MPPWLQRMSGVVTARAILCVCVGVFAIGIGIFPISTDAIKFGDLVTSYLIKIESEF